MGDREVKIELPASRLWVLRQMDRPEVFPVSGGSVAVVSAQRPSGDGENEDTCGVFPYLDGSLALAVCDGAGGMRGGGEAARVTVQALRAALRRGRQAGQPLRSAILDGLDEANRAVRDIGSGAAATVAVAEINGGSVRPYHVGDAVVLITGGRGRVKHQNLPHGPVGYAVEAGVLSETEAMHHDERHLVSNVIGSEDMRIEVGPPIRLAARDTLMLASDGVSDNMYLEEIVARIRRGPLSAAGDALLAECRRRMVSPENGEPSKDDDLTFVLFRPALPARPAPEGT